MGPNGKLLREAGYSKPLEFLYLFITNVVLNTFIIATNSYGQLFIKGWKSVALAEFKAFLAIVLILGIVKYPSREMAWEKSSYGCQCVQQLMSDARFNSILHAWHYEDYATYTADEIKQEKKKDPFFPVKTFLILLAASFKKRSILANSWISMSKAYLGRDDTSHDVTTLTNRRNGISKCTP
jgi:hypothetical protein